MMEQFRVDNHYLWRNKRLLLDENIDQGGHFFREKNKVAQNEKWILGFCIPKMYGTFWSVSLENFIKHAPLIAEECHWNLLTIVFLAKTLQVCFPTYHFSKAHCLILGIQFVLMWHWQNRTLCHKHILNKTQSKFHPLNTVVGINHKK